MPQEKLIEHASEIAAVNRVQQFLVGAIVDEDAEYLLRFRNPLEVISDLYINNQEKNGPFFYEVSEHLLYELESSGFAEYDYDVEPEFEPDQSMNMG